MDPNAVIADVARQLDAIGIPFMLAGSIATSVHGEPRLTHDVDVIIEASEAQIRSLVRALHESGNYYASEEAAREALTSTGMFNVIHLGSGWKVDLIFRKDRAFSREEFRRRIRRTVGALELPVVTPEDAILSKLEWAKESGSERQFRDEVGVAAVRFTELDRAYLHHWAKELGIQESLDRVLH